jgi:1,4-alpha-glucan branching enzyme
MKALIEYENEFLPSDFELYLFHEGTLYESYKMLGAHPIRHKGTDGVRFAVWAPHAIAVSVAGDFNDWDGSLHPMKRINNSGVWVSFIEGIEPGELYKYEIHTHTNEVILKADPYAFYSEKRPRTASVLHFLNGYQWNDQKWMQAREKSDVYHKPMLIYELHMGTWKKKENDELLTYRELADELIDYVLDSGYTHIELMPIMEHPFDRSWGYQITGYFSVTSRFGKPEDFKYFIDQCHQKGIGVILDWVPVHFCKDAHGLGRFDGTALYEPSDPLKAERANWGTYNFDFEKPEVRSFLISNALFWLEEYHIDGFRTDAVSYLIYLNHDNTSQVHLKNDFGGDENLQAISFLKKLNEEVFKRYPGVLMIAEEATDWPLVTAPTDAGGLGFNYKWNMGWANDVLKYMQLETFERPNHHNLLTFSFFYAFSENFILPFSHDEVVYGKRSLLNKMPGDYWQKFANLRVLYGYFMTHPGKKLLFMGGEFGQFDEWKDLTQLDWDVAELDAHQKFFEFSKAMNKLYQESSYFWRLDHEQSGFEWIDPNNAKDSILVFMRKGKRKGDYAVIVCNFSSTVYHQYRIGVPARGNYIEIFNSDEKAFGGTGQCNSQPIKADSLPNHNQAYSMEVTVPPLGIAIFKKQTKKRQGRKTE